LRIALEKNIENPISSITVMDLQEAYFDPNWHFHPHYQLFTVLEGEGTRLIGDSIQHFDAGDTVLLGPDLPHLWRSEKAYFKEDSNLKTRGIVVYFTQEFLDATILNLPESRAVNNLLKDSFRGLELQGNTTKLVSQELLKMSKSHGLDRVLLLHQLLNHLSKIKERSFISSVGYSNTHKVSETERMQKVYDYAMNHFKEDIKLKNVASLANMTIPAFCRYFKKRSNKTFSDFVAEIRIGHVCKMLDQKDVNIAQTAYESGYNTLSNFNKKFKELVGVTPSIFAKELKSK
jgi:AraC-like DNA-binding protein